MKISEYFERLKIHNTNKHQYIFKPNAPDWLRKAIYKVHQGGMPVDYLFDLCYAFVRDYDEGNVTQENVEGGLWADSQVDIYNSKLYQFAADHCNCNWYDDEQASELVGKEATPLDHIRMVQYVVAQSVAFILWDTIKEAEEQD